MENIIKRTARKNRNRVKAWACRISSGVLAAGTPIAVILLSPEMYFFKPESSMSAIALMAVILGAVSLKNTILKFFKTPSALKIWAVLFVLLYICQPIIHNLLVLSAFALAAQGVCVPLNMLDKKYTAMFENEQKEMKANEQRN